ncbi:MAG: glycosyltransferase family 39 protein [bacterium]|nr:glycosyltransferase family 39 protein [bacterium]
MLDIKNFFRNIRLSTLALIFVFSFIAFVSFYCFKTVPVSWIDEGVFFQTVSNIATVGIWGIQLAPDHFIDLSLIAMGYPQLYPAALAFKIFGTSITVLRLVSITFLLGFVTAFYFLSKKLYGPTLALWGTALLGTFSPLYGNGKNFLGEVPGLFYFILGLLLITYIEHSPKRQRGIAFIAGLALGMAISVKPIFILILPALGVAFLWHIRRFLFGENNRRSESVMVVVGMIGALVVWVFTQFGGEVSLVRIFTHYANPYYIADITALMIQNLKRFITELTPLHFLLMGFVADILFIQKIRKKDRIHFAEIAVAVFSALIFVFYLRTVGWYRNFFPGHIVLFLFFAPGLQELFSLVRVRFFQQSSGVLVGVVCTALLGAQFVPLKKEAIRCATDLPTATEPFLNTLAKDEPVFFYNTPEIAARFHGTEWYQYIRMSEHWAVGAENEDLMKKGTFSTIIVPHHLTNERSRIPSCYEIDRDIYKLIIIYKRNASLSCEGGI